MLPASPGSAIPPAQTVTSAQWRERCLEAEQRAAEAEQRAQRAEAIAAHLIARVAELEVQARELLARLKKDSSNSSKPPSSDAPGRGTSDKRKRKGGRKPSGRKPGGQPGHKGTTRELRPVAEAGRVVDHWPDHCERCHQGLDGVPEFGKPAPHQQYELPPLQLELIHHWLHQRICPHCGETSTGTLAPGEATGQGPRLTSFIAMMSSQEHHQSRSQVVRLLDHLFGVRFSKGTIQSCVERVGEALAAPYSEIVAALQKAYAAHFDETGWRQAGKRFWLWVATTAAFSLFVVHRRRGAEGLDALIPDGFDGFVHSDRWAVYNRFDVCRRQLCWAHLGRDLQAIIDAGGPGADRAGAMRKGEEAMFRHWHEFKDGMINRLGLRQATAPFRKDFAQFCSDGRAQDGDRRWHNLGKALVKLWPAVFNFIDTEGLEPTNNHAERIIRPSVIWRKITQGTRSDTGRICVSRILSVTTTCSQQGRDALDYLTDALAAHWCGIPPPALIE
jgi:transposase